MAAGPIFAEKLGEDYYPLALGAYDKMILMVYYLESVYGQGLGCRRPAQLHHRGNRQGS